MTVEQLLAAPPPSFSWPAGGIDGNAAPGLAVIGLTWGPLLQIPQGTDMFVSPVFVADTPARPWACAHVTIPPAPALCATALPSSPTVVRASPTLRPPPPRAAVVIRRR